ncbi:hypothetical protein [Salinigranum sp. GCM10025319]|uniref:hypothetical protein n=1 Tax=Salinigranum sp. GCM10025319 TaxID=3252687 RepID=UPI00361B080B
MSDDLSDRLVREAGEFVRFSLLWFGLGSAAAPARTVVRVTTGSRPGLWLGPVVAAVAATAVYWAAGRISWRLVGRAWLVGIAVAVLSIVGVVLFDPGDGSGIVAGAVIGGWWLASVAVGVGLTSPTVWRVVRDRVLLRPRSGS